MMAWLSEVRGSFASDRVYIQYHETENELGTVQLKTFLIPETTVPDSKVTSSVPIQFTTKRDMYDCYI